ncbi:MAG TPA: peroxiredoxin [Candidatus Gracilibacteria bacterium]|nr:peroxiredoxin [Candidatus Gracilibacteria bacterium]
MYNVQVGRPAPKFRLEALVDDKFQMVSTEDYKDKWIVLFFYPLDFTFVCPTEVVEFSNRAAEFEKLKAQIVGCSIDSVYSHKAWTKEIGNMNYPLMSDINRELSREYGILIEDKGMALRGLYIIDPKGILRYMVVHDLDVGRSVDETLRVLSALQSGKLCRVNWKKGDDHVEKK